MGFECKTAVKLTLLRSSFAKRLVSLSISVPASIFNPSDPSSPNKVLNAHNATMGTCSRGKD